jgi:broad specificity phosphatase PhoE
MSNTSPNIISNNSPSSSSSASPSSNINNNNTPKTTINKLPSLNLNITATAATGDEDSESFSQESFTQPPSESTQQQQKSNTNSNHRHNSIDITSSPSKTLPTFTSNSSSSSSGSSSLVRLVVVRHAEHVDPTKTQLSSKGSMQAKSIADLLMNTTITNNTNNNGKIFDRIYTSTRSRETADIIAEKLGGIDVVTDERLRNWDQGVTLGLTLEQIQEKMPEVYSKRYVQRDPTYKVPNGESLQDRFDRVSEFLRDAVSSNLHNIVVVTHGGVIDDMFRVAHGGVAVKERTGLLKPYGCVSVLLYENGTWKEKQWVSADHLPRIVAESPTGGHLYVFPHQVSGSMPLLRGDRGELCKPATIRELTVYNAMFAKDCFEAGIHDLAEKFVPKFLGTVDVDVEYILAGGGPQVMAANKDVSNTIIQGPLNTPKAANNNSLGGGNKEAFSVNNLWTRFARDRYKKMVPASDGSHRYVYLILENACHGFNKPHVLDVKMGYRQHNDDESQEKVQRKIERCKNSTSETMGIRLQGMQTYDSQLRKFVLRDKYYGRNLSEVDLKQCFEDFVQGFGRVAEIIALQIESLQQSIRATTWRFWGSSVLVVFDAESVSIAEKTAMIKLIDFGSCQMGPSPLDKPEYLPFERNPNVAYDQGLDRGLDNLSTCFREIAARSAAMNSATSFKMGNGNNLITTTTTSSSTTTNGVVDL